MRIKPILVKKHRPVLRLVRVPEFPIQPVRNADAPLGSKADLRTQMTYDGPTLERRTQHRAGVPAEKSRQVIVFRCLL